MTTPALELRGVARRFGSTQVLAGIDLSIATGERHALIGPNGAGKSTLFNLIGGAMRPDAGRILLAGVDITGRAPYALARLGLGRSYQTTRVFARLSVLDNLRCAALCGSAHPRGWRCFLRRTSRTEDQVRRIAEALGLAQCIASPADWLGYGEQRALDLGMALASGAQMLLVDEPTAGMNREEAGRAIALLGELSEGKTLLMIEHDMDVVFRFADRISVLVQGRILATGTPAEIRVHQAVRTAYLGEAGT
ncbi:ABC transporter ATP-binding protein [Trinickia sp. LjRoot230]|uniref:ABC transporter ATP-binding protein n=1 Tax=Trinickia sp. LjRoot230 TaxID=3342288 RepID=UPI003ECD92F8